MLETIEMGVPRVAMLTCAMGMLAMLAMDVTVVVGDGGSKAPVDNVATQWSYLVNQIICALPITTGPPTEPNIILAQLHLAQWHALLALKNAGECTTQEIVVAYASHKVMSTYFPLQQSGVIDPLLDSQLTSLNASPMAQKLGKQLGQAVALDLVGKNPPAREFALQALKNALNEPPRPGLYRYLNDTPAGRDAATFLFYDVPITQPYVVPDPIVFIKAFLSDLSPPKVPSAAWDKEYAAVVDLGRADWPGRTAAINITAVNSGCLKSNSPGTDPVVTCFSEQSWAAAARATLPSGTSLYNTVLILATLHVAMHDAFIIVSTMQYGFWNWRPEMAFKAGDAHHKPIPTWTPYIPTPTHTEFPSAAVTSFAAAATVLDTMIGDSVPFTLPGGGVWGPGCPVEGPIPDLKFSSFGDYVSYIQMSRVYCGAHFNHSVHDALRVGATVASYVQAHWGDRVPAGALPNPSYLSVFAQLPHTQPGFDPIRLVY